MKRPSYKHAVELVALNDGNGDSGRLICQEVECMTTVQLISDLFGVPAYDFAKAVVTFRQKQDLGS